MREVSRRCIETLFSTAGDADAAVRAEVVEALRLMAQKDCAGVLNQCCGWFTAKPASATPPLQRYVILKAMVTILAEQKQNAKLDDKSLRTALLQCGIREMTAIADLSSEWSREASSLVVEMCDLFPGEGSQALLAVLPSNALPHFFVISTLFTFAEKSPLRFIPYLKEVLAKLLPVLGLAKQDSHRMLLAQALGIFAEAVIVTNSPCPEDFENAVDAKEAMAVMLQNPLEDFADVMYSAIHFLTGDYSRSNELRVRMPVTLALGSLFAICEDEKRIALMPKVLPLVVAGVKREKPRELLLPARGFAAMLSFVSMPMAEAMLPYMDGLFDLLVRGLVMLHAEGENAHAATKAAYLVAAENFTLFYVDGLLTSISKVLDPKNGAKDAATRAAVVRIMQHLLSKRRCEERLGGYKDSVVATLKLAMSEQDWNIRKAVVLCIVNMGNSSIDFFQAVGGSDLLTYVIRNAAIADSTIDEWASQGRTGGASPLDLRDFCRNTLSSMCSSNGRLDECLWPFLLEHMSDYKTSPMLINAFTTICPCLVQLGSRVAQTERYYIDFSACVNVPRPASLAAIFLSQVAQAGVNRPDELLTILEAMSSIAAIIDDPFGQTTGAEVTTPIGELWLAVVPELQSKLPEEEYQSFEAWEEVLSRLASKTVSVKQSEIWAADFVNACVALLPAYQGRSKLFRSTLLFAGIGLGQSSKKDFVAEMLERFAEMCNHDDLDHRVGAAKAFGYVSAKHTDAVLDVLRRQTKGPEKKSGGGLFGGGAPKPTGKRELVENSKSLAALSFGYVCRRMPREILASRLDTAVLPPVLSLLQDGCTAETKRSIFEACVLMEAPIVKQGSYVFKSRDALIIAILNSLPLASAPPGNAPNVAAGASSAALQTLVTTAFHGVASLVRCTANPTLGPTAREAISDTILKVIARGGAGGASWPDWSAINESTSDAMKATLLHDSPPNLEVLVAKVLPRTVSTGSDERHAAMHLVNMLIESTNVEIQRLLSSGAAGSGSEDGVKMRFNVGSLIARLVPRFMDSMPEIRSLAADSIVSTYRLLEMKHADMVQKHEIQIDSSISEITQLKERVMSLVKDGTASAEKEMSGITKGLCVSIVGVMPESDVFVPLLDTLLACGLVDPQDDAAGCSCVTLHGMIRGVGGSLKEADARRVFGNLMDSLEKVSQRELSKNGVLVCIRNLTKHHNVLCFDSILGFPTPHSPTVVAAFQSIAHDGNLSTLLVQHILDTVLNSQLLTDLPVPRSAPLAPTGGAVPVAAHSKVLVPVPLAAICALGWISEIGNGSAACEENRASVIMTLVIYLSVAHECGTVSQVELVVDALRRVLAAVAEEITVDRVERFGWKQLSTAGKFTKALQDLTKYLCREGMGDTNEGDRGRELSPEWGLALEPAAPTTFTGEIAQFMIPYCSHPMSCYRRAALSVCGMLVRYSLGHAQLLQSLITSSLSRTGDNEDALVRAEVLECFQYVLVHPYEDISTFVSPIFSALLANMTESHVLVGANALKTLSALVLRLTDKSLISPTLVNLTIKLRVLFDAKDAILRKHAFLTLSQLYELGNLDMLDRAAVDQQVYSNLVPLLVHCEDTDPQATTAAKVALHEAFKLIARSKPAAHTKIYQLLWKPHVRPTADMRFEEFAEDFCSIWVSFFIGRVKDTLMEASSYFNSDVESLRAATAILFGQMLKLVPPEELTRCNVEMASSQLIQMLGPGREKSADVRKRVAQAIGRISDL